MGVTSRPPRRNRRLALVAGIAACWLLMPAVSMAASSSDASGGSGGSSAGDSSHPSAGDPGAAEMNDATATTPAIEVTVRPLVNVGRGDGDLILVDEEAGFVALLFSPGTPAEQRALHEVRVRNVGDAPLGDLHVTDDRVGTIIDAATGTRLEPGEDLVTRVDMSFTFAEVSTALGGLFRSTITATATAEDGTLVEDTAETRVELVAVLASPTIDVALEVVPGAGDVQAGDPPTLQWTAAQREADEVRVVRYRVSVTNTSSAELEAVAISVDWLDAPLVAADDGVMLGPGESHVREFERAVRPTDLAGQGSSVDVASAATATAVDPMQGLTVTGRDQTLVRAVLLAVTAAPQTPPPAQLPAAGLNARVTALLMVAAFGSGIVLLRSSRRFMAP